MASATRALPWGEAASIIMREFLFAKLCNIAPIISNASSISAETAMR